MRNLLQETRELFGLLGPMHAIGLWYNHTVASVGTKASQRITKTEASLDLQAFPDEASEYRNQEKDPETAFASQRPLGKKEEEPPSPVTVRSQRWHLEEP